MPIVRVEEDEEEGEVDAVGEFNGGCVEVEADVDDEKDDGVEEEVAEAEGESVDNAASSAVVKATGDGAMNVDRELSHPSVMIACWSGLQ